MARRHVTDEDRIQARRLLLTWLAGDQDDIGELTFAAFELHVEYNTFPGEEFMGLAADALDVAGVARTDPIAYETLLVDHLPEVGFKGKQYRKIRFAVMSSAGLRGGLDPDLLDEVAYWNDDYWRYALLAAVALIRASAVKAGCSVGQLCHRLATVNGLDLDAPGSDGDLTG
jgi:hypothetical protein